MGLFFGSMFLSLRSSFAQIVAFLDLRLSRAWLIFGRCSVVAFVMIIVLHVFSRLFCARVDVTSFRASGKDGESVGSPLPENAMSFSCLYCWGMSLNCACCHRSPDRTSSSIWFSSCFRAYISMG